MGTWHSHTGRIELKERWRKTFRTVWNDKFRCSIWQRETARNMNWFQARHSHTAQICTGLFCQRQGYLRRTRFLPTLSQNPKLSIHGTSGWPMPSFAAMPATSMNDFSVSCWSQRNSCRSQTNPSKFLCDLHEFVCNLGGLVCSLSTLAVICSTFALHPCDYNCKASKPRAQSLGWHRTRRCCNHSCYMQEHQPQACSNRKQYRWFSLPTVAYQMQWVHINPCVQNAFEVSKPCFFGTPDNSWAPSWAPGNHTQGGMGPKDRCEGKLFGRSETTSSLALTCGTGVHALKRHSIVDLHSYCSTRRNGS